MISEEATTISAAISATAKATRQMRHMILTGKIASGQKIDQRKIAKTLNLTTSPVREAFCRLESEGLIDRVPGVGVFCKAYTVDEIEDLMKIREYLEGLAARYAAERINREEKEKLWRQAEWLAEHESRNKKVTVAESFNVHHINFHLQIVRATKSKQLIQRLEREFFVAEIINNIVDFIFTDSQTHPNHLDVTKAICSGDAELAERVMRSHTKPTDISPLIQLRERHGGGLVTPEYKETSELDTDETI